MADEAAEKREAIRLLRGGVVRALYRVLDTGTQATLVYLRRVLRPESERALSEALSYLVAAGYVEQTVSKLDALDMAPLTLFKLSAKGMQLCEGAIEDASVVLD